jgi:hypothetical protein
MMMDKIVHVSISWIHDDDDQAAGRMRATSMVSGFRSEDIKPASNLQVRTGHFWFVYSIFFQKSVWVAMVRTGCKNKQQTTNNKHRAMIGPRSIRHNLLLLIQYD